MNLAYKYPLVYWNTANLIVDSGGVQTVDYTENEDESLDVELAADDDKPIEESEDDEDQEEWEKANDTTSPANDDQKKVKSKNVDYGKIASTIGRLINYGIKVSPPDINKSSFTFTPLAKENIILYGLRGIARISSDKIEEIMNNRPYLSLNDFITKNHLNKLQLLNLIKSGAFDELENKPREQIMQEYIESITDKKQRLTLQNMQMLIDQELIPEEMKFYAQLFLFNKYLKTQKDGAYYKLNDAALNFIDKYFSLDYTSNGDSILQLTWDKIYKKGMEPMRDYLKANQQIMLETLNNKLYQEVYDKYAQGNISSWEMSSLSFYYHPHELAEYTDDFTDFFSLPEEPQIEYTFKNNKGQDIPVYKLYRIAGTVIDKDKMRNTITLLTPTGVVNVKIYKVQFAMYDKQISQMGIDGHKHVIEPSWFKRGTLLMIQGIRRGQDFVPKKMKSSIYPVISKINNINNGKLELQFERQEVVE